MIKQTTKIQVKDLKDGVGHILIFFRVYSRISFDIVGVELFFGTNFLIRVLRKLTSKLIIYL